MQSSVFLRNNWDEDQEIFECAGGRRRRDRPGFYLGILQLYHEVLPRELYRSAQPWAADIATYARQYAIKTIVNLRGKSREGWYQQEVDAALGAGIAHIDFRRSASGSGGCSVLIWPADR